jgi:hypothetical protein
VTFGLQPITLNSSLKNWSKDLHDIFTYMQSKNPDLKGRAEKILEVLFTKTLHSGHWSCVQFGARTKFFEQSNHILSLVVLTWLCQLQQFFLNDEHRHKNGDWNNLEKYTGVTTNPMKNTTRQTSTYLLLQNQRFLHKLLTLTNPNQNKTSQGSVHHWKNGCWVFSNQTKQFSCRTLMTLILKQKAVSKEYRRRFYRNSKSRQQILLLILTTLTLRTTILQNLTLTQRETKTCQSTN